MGLTVTILPNSLKICDWYTHYSTEEISYLNHVNSGNKESFIQFKMFKGKFAALKFFSLMF